MRKLVFHMQTTLDGRIARADGSFWEPFDVGEAEQRWLNDTFRPVDTWVLGRTTYDVIVPWWLALHRDGGGAPLDQEFAALLAGMHRVMISSTRESDEERDVIGGDEVVARVAELKERHGDGVIALSGGPATLAPFFAAGLVDETLVVLNPKVLTAGPRWFDGLDRELNLTLLDATALGNGAVAVRHAVG